MNTEYRDEHNGTSIGWVTAITSTVKSVTSNTTHHGEVVAGGGAVEGRPAVRVLRVDVTAEGDEERDDVEVAGADGVVERRDALVVGGGGVSHLRGGN